MEPRPSEIAGFDPDVFWAIEIGQLQIAEEAGLDFWLSEDGNRTYKLTAAHNRDEMISFESGPDDRILPIFDEAGFGADHSPINPGPWLIGITDRRSKTIELITIDESARSIRLLEGKGGSMFHESSKTPEELICEVGKSIEALQKFMNKMQEKQKNG